MKWVTWEQVGIDRIGSAWLIRRTSPNDQTALERGDLVYEALYAQLAAEPG